MISIAVRHSFGEQLIKRAAQIGNDIDGEADGEQLLLQVELDEIPSRKDDDAASDYIRIVSYTCGIAIAAIVLVMATRRCQRMTRNNNQLRIARSRDAADCALVTAAILLSLDAPSVRGNPDPLLSTPFLPYPFVPAPQTTCDSLGRGFPC